MIATDCDRYVESEQWVAICSDLCRCTSPLCASCETPLQDHRPEVQDAYFESDVD